MLVKCFDVLVAGQTYRPGSGTASRAGLSAGQRLVLHSLRGACVQTQGLPNIMICCRMVCKGVLPRVPRRSASTLLTSTVPFRPEPSIIARSFSRGMELSDEIWNSAVEGEPEDLDLVFPTNILSTEQVCGRSRTCLGLCGWRLSHEKSSSHFWCITGVASAGRLCAR
jgi:hypothetical protein